MTPDHVISSLYCLHKKLTFRVWLSVSLIDGVMNPVFVVEYDHDYDNAPFTLYLCWEELEFLTRDTLEYGRCGHISTCSYPGNRFVVRDEDKTTQKSRYVRCLSPPIPVNGEFFKDMQRLVKRVFEDLTLAQGYIKNGKEPVTLTQRDSVFLKRLIASYAYDTLQHVKLQGHFDARERAVENIISDVDIEKFNRFLAPSKLRIKDDVDVRGLAMKTLKETGKRKMVSYENVCIGGRWVAHLLNCKGNCTAHLK